MLRKRPTEDSPHGLSDSGEGTTRHHRWSRQSRWTQDPRPLKKESESCWTWTFAEAAPGPRRLPRRARGPREDAPQELCTPPRLGRGGRQA